MDASSLILYYRYRLVTNNCLPFVTANGLGALQTSECPKSHITRFHIYSHLWKAKGWNNKTLRYTTAKITIKNESKERNNRCNTFHSREIICFYYFRSRLRAWFQSHVRDTACFPCYVKIKIKFKERAYETFFYFRFLNQD